MKELFANDILAAFSILCFAIVFSSIAGLIMLAAERIDVKASRGNKKPIWMDTPSGRGRFVAYNGVTDKVTVEMDGEYLVEVDAAKCSTVTKTQPHK